MAYGHCRGHTPAVVVDTRARAGCNGAVVAVSVWWARVEDGGDPAAALLRAAVADHAGCASDDVVNGRLCPHCGSTAHGRPVVLTPRTSTWRVSLSRAPGLVAVAVAEGGDTAMELGVDVEEVARTAFAGFPCVTLHPLERDGAPAERGLIWTRKEAVLKAAGVGLRTDPRSIQVSHPSQPPALEIGPNVALGQRFWLEDIPVPTRYAATVAVVASSATAPEVIVREVAPGAWAGAASDGEGRRDRRRSARRQQQ